MRSYPVDSVNVASGYGWRTVNGARQGHWGLDLAGAAGDAVRAPEAGEVVAVWTGSGVSAPAPWDGYGPGGVELQGDSGAYHVLAHLEVPRVAIGDRVSEGDVVGVMPARVGASGPHTHWEVRRVAVDGPSTRQADTIDPRTWVKGGNVADYVPTGNPLVDAAGNQQANPDGSANPIDAAFNAAQRAVRAERTRRSLMALFVLWLLTR